MNMRLLSKYLGYIALLVAACMIFSLPWAFPSLGHSRQFEHYGFWALSGAIIVSAAVGAGLLYMGRFAAGQLFRKEAMAIVGLSWVLATFLGALPYWLSGTLRNPAVVIAERDQTVRVFGVAKEDLSPEEFALLDALLAAGITGRTAEELSTDIGRPDAAEVYERLVTRDDLWRRALAFRPDTGRYAIGWQRMTWYDALFESQSGFSTTGATVLTEVENPSVVPRCVLFWRSTTHFLGGLGIMVLFVAVLGQGSAGKALMRSEMPGPSKETAQQRMQHAAWVFASIYIGLNIALSLLLMLQHMNLFDALCHAFGTMATGGFSTYNKSIGHFDSVSIEITVIVFMVLAGTNFTLLYLLLLFQPRKMLADVEWRAYAGIIGGVTCLVVVFGLWRGDFSGWGSAVRYGSFQVVSILTTTGYGTHDFDQWNSFGRGVLFLLMFVGGCAGSTGGGLKVIRHILFLKILRLEVEQAYHPSVVRPLRLGGEPVENQQLRTNILVYFSLILVIFVFSWISVVTVEPDATWGSQPEHKLIDSASAIAATLNNIGPGLGTVGATHNYAHFTWFSKCLFTWLMVLGRLELFAVLVLFAPGFWRSQ